MGLDSELRMSPRPVLVVLLALAIVLFLATQFVAAPREVTSPVMTLLLLVGGLTVLGWLLIGWRGLLGRWFTVVALFAAIHAAHALLGLPSVLVLAGIPVAVSASLISVSAAFAVAGAESLVLAGMLGYGVVGLDASHLGVALIGMWATVGVTIASFGPARQLSDWVKEYFDRAQRNLEEARDRKAELERAMESLAHTNRQLALAGERMAALRTIAEDAQRAKTAFVANVSHEFRTPLNMIIGLVDLMVETPAIYDVILSPKMRDDLRVVYRNCEHLANMIDDVLDLSRLEAGRLALHRERVDLHEIVDSCVAAVYPLLEKKGLSVTVTLPEGFPKVYCDRTRIKQVVLNLLSNAARFTEVGGIDIVVARRDQQVVVSVADTGPGILAEDAGRIFEPFYQGSHQLWRDKGGSGLGLSISRRFVELHGGRMWLEGDREAGTCFVFALPISPPVEHVARPGHQIREDWAWRERSFLVDRFGSVEELVKPRVIVCDETGTLSDQFSRFADGVEIVDARSLDQVTQGLHRCPAHAVIVNAPTPGDVWPSMAMAVEQVRDTPLIGCSVPRTVGRATEAGALGHLVKPVTRADLERALQTVKGPVNCVLVVDDDPDVLALFSRMLLVCDGSLEVVTARGGEEALEELRNGTVDLMLLDVVMPEMDGWELFERIAEDETVRDVPTFFVSAQDPTDQLPVSDFLVATVGNGLSPSTLLRCSLELSGLLLGAGAGPYLAPL